METTMTEESQLTWYLESMSELMKKCNQRNSRAPDFKGHGLEAFVLEYGRPMKHEVYDPEKWGVIGENKECYANAARLAMRHDKYLIYCEGYAASIIPCLHAWCIERASGVVVDPTWKEGITNEPVLHADYYGISMQPGFMARVMLQSKTYGVLEGVAWEILTKQADYHIEDMEEK